MSAMPPQSFTCPRCGMASSHPTDVEQGYCGNCHDWTGSKRESVLPPPDEWNSAVEHSTANPSHILGPYEDEDGQTHIECMGDGDPYEPSNCDFTTIRPCGAYL